MYCGLPTTTHFYFSLSFVSSRRFRYYIVFKNEQLNLKMSSIVKIVTSNAVRHYGYLIKKFGISFDLNRYRGAIDGSILASFVTLELTGSNQISIEPA
jgi:hypothetical protein